MNFQNNIGNLQQLFTQLNPAGAANKAGQLGGSPASNAAQPANPRVASASVDQASLSSTSGLVAQASLSSDVRSEKVAALQQAIAAGTYNISSTHVADKIISSLLDRSLA